jgi:hypothetical protein
MKKTKIKPKKIFDDYYTSFFEKYIGSKLNKEQSSLILHSTFKSMSTIFKDDKTHVFNSSNKFTEKTTQYNSIKPPNLEDCKSANIKQYWQQRDSVEKYIMFKADSIIIESKSFFEVNEKKRKESLEKKTFELDLDPKKKKLNVERNQLLTLFNDSVYSKNFIEDDKDVYEIDNSLIENNLKAVIKAYYNKEINSDKNIINEIKNIKEILKLNIEKIEQKKQLIESIKSEIVMLGTNNKTLENSSKTLSDVLVKIPLQPTTTLQPQEFTFNLDEYLKDLNKEIKS